LAITLFIVSAERNLNKNAFPLGNLNKMVSMVKNGSFSDESLNRLTSTICPNGNANCCIRIYGSSNAPNTRLSCGNAALYGSADAIVANGFVISTVDPEANGQTTWESSGCVTTPLSMSTLGGAATCSATSNDVCVVTGSTPVYNLGTSTATFDTCTCQTTTTPNCGATTATCLYCPPANPNCCGTTCTNFNTDTSNCGSCGNTCGSGTNIGLSTCCPAGLGGAAGCKDLSDDPNNCGTCNHVCASGDTCVTGGCVSASHLYYAGDFDPTNANKNGLYASNTGSGSCGYVYQEFIFPTSNSIVNVFGNYQCSSSSDLTTANVEIRTGVTSGNGGTVVMSYSGLPTTVVDTGMSCFGLEIFTITVTLTLPLVLPTCTYYITLQPISSSTFCYLANTFGLNSVNSFTPNNNYFDSSSFGADFCNANNNGDFCLFSFGVNSGFPPADNFAPEISIIKTDKKEFKIKENQGLISTQCGGNEVSSCADLETADICGNFWQSPDQNGNSFQCRISPTPLYVCVASNNVCS